MGILDWFINRPAQLDLERSTQRLTDEAIDKAVTLANPQIKAVVGYRERLWPTTARCVDYLRTIVRALPVPVSLSSDAWSSNASVRAFFARAQDIPAALGRSVNLRTLFAKFPELPEAHCILGMNYREQQVFGMSLAGDVVQREVPMRVASFADHEVRICGASGREVCRLLGVQLFEYLVAQALAEIGEVQSERRELEENRALIRARLRLLSQHGPGLGSVFGEAPGDAVEQHALEAELADNGRQLEALGGAPLALERSLATLEKVLGDPEAYLRVEQTTLAVDAMNVMVEQAQHPEASIIVFSRARLEGTPKRDRAFVLARFSRGEMPPAQSGFAGAERFL